MGVNGQGLVVMVFKGHEAIGEVIKGLWVIEVRRLLVMN